MQLQRAVSEAVQTVGFAYFVFASSVSADEGSAFYPTMHTLPAAVVDAMLTRGGCRANPVLAGPRQTNEAVVVSMNVSAPNPVIAAVSQFVAPYGIVSAVFVPVLSATEDLSIIGGYSCGGTPSPDEVS